MRMLCTLMLATLITFPAYAQVIIDKTAPLIDYPDDPQVPNPMVPSAPVPESPASPKGGDVPPSPPSPSLKPSKLWPADTVPVFMLSCTQLQKEIVGNCRCVIDALMQAIPHDEFMQLSEAGLIEKDQRYLRIRQRCLGTPQKK